MLSDYDLNLIRYEQRWPREQRLTRTGIPSRYWDCTWDEFRERDATIDLREGVIEYAKTFLDGEPRMAGGRGLLLQGPPGVGKTMAASLLGVELSDAGFFVRFMPLADYINRQIRQFTLQKSWERYENLDAHEEWKEADESLRVLREVAHLVILDDVGKEHHTASNYAVDTLDAFLRRRGNIGRPVVMTSNVGVPEWRSKYGPAMHSFVHEACDILSATGKDDMRRNLARS